MRVEQYLSRRALWLDESSLVVNIVQRDFGRLLDPLEGDQGAPPLFLWLERVAVLVGGNNEYALRVVPLAAGIALLPLVWALGQRVAPGRRVGPFAAVLVAFSPTLVRYATDVKQYAVDAALTAAIVLLALRTLPPPAVDDTAPRGARWQWGAFAGVGAVSVWLSHPATLTLAGVGGALAVDALRRGDRRRLGALACTGAVPAASLAVAYAVSLRDLRANDALEDYWAAGYPSGAWVSWVWDAVTAFVDDPARLGSGFVAVLSGILAVSGAVLLARRPGGGIRIAVVTAPFAVAVVAALLRLYPFSGRLALFLVPLLLVLVAVAVDRVPLLAAPAVLLVTAPWWSDTADVVRSPPEFVESRAVFEHVAAAMRPGDIVVVHGPAVAPYRYYGPIVGLRADQHSDWAAAPCAALPGEGRLWFVFAYTFSARPDDEAERARRQLDAVGDRVELFEKQDASATLFELGGGDATPVPDDEVGCLALVPLDPLPRSGLSTGPFGTGHET